MVVDRITPAPAGKTIRTGTCGCCKQDHPRTCGENIHRYTSFGLQIGSPPHLRGKLLVCIFIVPKSRITPAPAGKTYELCKFVGGNQDHPRTCGENFSALEEISTPTGSPPHLRGKLFSLFENNNPIRITPAPAGKTLKNDVDTL